ncbi:carbohydrate ABC transporter permease [Ructibacterium gallinarum]|uniref:Carbohydrate ABC transporter permease n=1 Tax=Ructibacterium gallinarum TaxID=2779355 RepID=A0A9D5M390_9FIRM|nr:carbohydrate ABC transporter permease [Ructibacterium gallinarum]MBE5040718.1 carbohydrate ABC transporter permease [Ructibacterium gallinarum]
MNIKNKTTMMISHAILLLLMLLTLFPIIYTFTSSFKTNMELMTEPGRLLPVDPTVENYELIWNSDGFNIGRLLWNSTYYTLINVFISVMISSMAGYVFARGEFFGKKFVFACFTALMFVKTGNITVYPQFDILNALNLNKGLWALMIIHLFGIPVVNIYLVRGFVLSLPKALDEAAQIDGCSFIGTFFKIIMPLLKPILATIAILSFNLYWNDYILPTVFTTTKPEQQTLMVGLMALKSTSGAASNWNLMMAGSVIALLPLLVAYAFGNKYFVSGLAAGAVKG